MAENKKSFVLYADLLKSIEHLTFEEKGILFNHLLEYVNDKNPVLTDRLILTAWKPIELQLKRDLIKFNEVKAKRSDAGKRSAELRALKNEEQNPTNSTSVDFVQQTSTNPTVNDNDNVTDNDNVNDTVSTKVDDVSNIFDNSKNLMHSKNLKDEALQWQETVAMQLKIAPAEIPKKLDEFTTFLSTTFKTHQNKKEFISHFINWLPKNLTNEKSTHNNREQFKFSTSEAIETITRGTA